MAYQFGSKSKQRMEGVDPRLIAIAERALEISSRRIGGIDFTIPPYGGLRNEVHQKELFEKGVTRADGVDKKSYHQSGKALDVIPYVKGNRTYPAEEYFFLVAVCMLQAAAALGHQLRWGGNWHSFRDLPHYEIRD